MAKASKIPVAVMNNPPAAVSIQRPCYAMATTDGQSADITMYGQIVEKQPVDWKTNEPIPGQYIIESEFLDDLNRISGCDSITIHMDSLGGDAGVWQTKPMVPRPPRPPWRTRRPQSMPP